MSYETPSLTPESRTSGSKSFFLTPTDVHSTLRRHLLVDGFEMVVDLERSRGSRIYDALNDRQYLDFFTFFASSPVGINHPKMLTDEFRDRIFHAAVNKPSNSDIYTLEMAEFVDTFSRVAIPDYLPHAFFIEGGALAVENALKTAFDWKVQKNFEKGHGEEHGHKIIHFEHAFHGRSGYTMSLTNTDPTKIRHYPKFPGWPRITSPGLRFPLTPANVEQAIALEQQAVAQIKQAFRDNPDDIAAIIIEPIQAEGGDFHFRPEFLQQLRTLADENEALLIFDEIQTGIGLTGKMWAHQYFTKPDIMCFGKKMQVCGILAGSRVDEVEGNVFAVSSRINSTWGGNLVDMVRSQRYLEIIEEERLVDNAATVGLHLLDELHAIAEEHASLVSNVRGRGLFCAIDLATPALRDTVRNRCFELGLIILGCGAQSLRFRPALNITGNEIDEGLNLLRTALREAKKA
ncbi:MAG: L-lysine 6-transaminase [Ignavibacteria bacterium]|nr:L-lysine 6-transaminase [Ignavibacteria bacterium]